MVATRRTANDVASASINSNTSSSSPNSPLKTSFTMPPTSKHYPGFPTPIEAILLSIYPATLLLGSLFSHLSPSLRPPINESIYSPAHQSFQPPEAAPSYFAQKRNIFNVYFVKIGWFWCTLALTLFTFLVGRGRFAASPRADPGVLAFNVHIRDNTTARLVRGAQVFLRWAIATLLWVLVTQWFFGPSIVDRGFSLTGGACRAGIEHLRKQRLTDVDEAEIKITSALTHAACSAAGGRWTGGWDISGHVFLLVLGSGMLWFEILPFVRYWSRQLGVDQRLIKRRDGSVATVLQQYSPHTQNNVASPTTAMLHSSIPYSVRAYALTFALGIAVLSWWMLLMTAAFFHTWFEKLMGCVVAFFGIWITYYLPRAEPILREVIGMPGL